MEPQPQLTSTNAPLAKTTHFLGVVLSFTAVLFAYSAQIEELTKINPKVAMYWPIILGAATFIDRLVKLVISIIDTFKKMYPLIVIALLFTGCVSTTVYDPAGHKRFTTGGDSTNVSYTDEHSTLSVQGLDHSKTNRITSDTVTKAGAGIITTATILAK